MEKRLKSFVLTEKKTKYTYCKVVFDEMSRLGKTKKYKYSYSLRHINGKGKWIIAKM